MVWRKRTIEAYSPEELAVRQAELTGILNKHLDELSEFLRHPETLLRDDSEFSNINGYFTFSRNQAVELQVDLTEIDDRYALINDGIEQANRRYMERELAPFRSKRDRDMKRGLEKHYQNPIPTVNARDIGID
ncbi:hypothetical protein CMI42_00950 [Candidatus Pacearchaeota archaeon]|nr:hypothetical protein [Candidatus Pacearchaeota archaeon]|tara:strand:+ start:2768 stop:3166 length:399 start_codon:yes stop_codon:yes gene_type:complete